MAIQVACGECFRQYDVPDRFAGKKVRCKSCGSSMGVPAFGVSATEAPVTVASTSDRRSPKRSQQSESHVAAPSGLMWWLIGGGAAFALVLLAVSFLTPLGLLIAIGLFVVGMLVLAVGQVMLIVTAFNEDATQGLLVFFVPVYPLFYLFSRWPKTSKSVWLYGAGIGAALLSIPTGLGGTMATASWLSEFAEASDPPPQGGPTTVAGNSSETAVEGPAGMPPQFAPPGAFPPPGSFPPPNAFPPPATFPPPDVMPPTFPEPRGFGGGDRPPGARIGDDDAEASEPVTVTWHLSRTTGLFDRNADPEASAEAKLAEVEGYIPGSVEIDLAAGRVTLEARPEGGTIIRARSALFQVGLIVADQPPPTPWVDPTQPRSITLTIRSTTPALEQVDDINATVEQILSEIEGYVTGSAKVDLDGKRITYDAYPGSRAERSGSVALLRTGLNVIQTRERGQPGFQ